MIKISKSLIEVIEKSQYKDDDVWKELKSFWLCNFPEYRLLDKLPDEFLLKIRNFLKKVCDEEIKNLDKSIWFAESFDDDVIEMLMEDYIKRLKNTKKRLIHNASVIHSIDDRLCLNTKSKID